MAGKVACRACGVALPGRVDRCPACGSRAGLVRSVARFGLAAVVVALVVGGWGLSRRPRVDPALAGDVRLTAGVIQISADGKQIVVPVRVANKNPVAVDAIVRVRVHNPLGGAGAVVESERFGDFPPESTTTVSVVFDLVPLDGVEVEVAELARSPR